MSKIAEIIKKYARNEMTLDEANAALKKEGWLSLDPEQNVITPEEVAATTVGETPAEANGFGMMDDGITPQKVKVTNGKLDHAVNEVYADGSTTAKIFVYVLDKKYEVFGDELR